MSVCLDERKKITPRASLQEPGALWILRRTIVNLVDAHAVNALHILPRTSPADFRGDPPFLSSFEELKTVAARPSNDTIALLRSSVRVKFGQDDSALEGLWSQLTEPSLVFIRYRRRRRDGGRQRTYSGSESMKLQNVSF